MIISADTTKELIKAIEILSKQNTEIRTVLNTLINSPESHFKTFGTIYVSIGVVLLGIFGQIIIFRLNRKNSLKQELAELYASYASKHTQYIQYFTDLSKCNFFGSVYEEQIIVYDNIIESENGSTRDAAYFNKNAVIKTWNELLLKKESVEKLHHQTKAEILKILFKIHFFIKNDKFYEQLKSYENMGILYKDSKFDKKKIMDEDYYGWYYQEKLHRATTDLEMAFYEMEEILEKYN